MKSIRERRGASLAEYGITVGLISAVAIGSVLLVGEDISRIFMKVESEVGIAGKGPPPPPPSPILMDFQMNTWVAGSAEGYGDTPGYGSITYNSNQIGDIWNFYYTADSDISRFEFRGEHLPEAEDWILKCGSDGDFRLGDATSWSYATSGPPEGFTYFDWRDYTGHGPMPRASEVWNCTLERP